MDTEQNVNIITPEDVEFKVPKAGMKMGAKMEIHKHTNNHNSMLKIQVIEIQTHPETEQ